jgi:uncharacterized protein
MRALVLCDDYWHPARTPRTGLAPLEAEGFAFNWIEDAREWSSDLMTAYPLVVLTKSNNISAVDRAPWVIREVEVALRDYVRKGNGLLVIHSGSADYREQTILRSLLGGVFASHPPQCPVTIEPRSSHPIAAGIDPFTVFDEHYFMDFDDPQAEVIMTTRSEHGAQPGGWTRSEGNGRVCLLTPGHNLEVWLHPTYQALLHNALHWCSKTDR